MTCNSTPEVKFAKARFLHAKLETALLIIHTPGSVGVRLINSAQQNKKKKKKAKKEETAKVHPEPFTSTSSVFGQKTSSCLFSSFLCRARFTVARGTRQSRVQSPLRLLLLAAFFFFFSFFARFNYANLPVSLYHRLRSPLLSLSPSIPLSVSVAKNSSPICSLYNCFSPHPLFFPLYSTHALFFSLPFAKVHCTRCTAHALVAPIDCFVR